MLGFALPYESLGYLFVLTIPLLLRLEIMFWFGVRIVIAKLVGQLVVVAALAAVVALLPWDGPVLGLYLLMEGFGISALLKRHFRYRGISLGSNTGPRVQLIGLFVLLNFSMIVFLLLQHAVGVVELPLAFLIANYLMLGVLALVKYSDSAFAFKPLVNESKYAKSTLDEAEKYRILSNVDQQLKRDQYYLDPNASLAGLAGRVKANSHQVSQVINESKGMTFFELMAFHRVQHAKTLLQDHDYDHFKIEQIAEEVGYLSKSAFNTAFKRITGFTPTEYKQQDVRGHKVERRDHREIAGNSMDEGTFGYLINSSIMFSNFFKVYLRNQLRNRAFSAVNLLGLVAGLSSTILIFVYLNHELSYDRFHDGAEDIYRVTWMTANPQTRTPHPLAQALARDFTQVQSAVSITPVYGPGLTLQSTYIRNIENNVMFKEPDLFMADSTFFDVFDFQLVLGNKDDVLDDVGDVVITEELALKYFGSENPLGKPLEFVEYDASGIVAGVMETPPANSHFHPQILLSYVTRKSSEPDNPWFTWADFGHFNYVKLAPGADPNAVGNALPDWLTNYLDLTPDQIESLKAREVYLDLQPMTDIHLHSDLRWELEANSSIRYVYILVAAIVFLLVIASINFVNLSTARAFERSKEVGIRRTLGAHKASISTQFIVESIVTTMLSLVVAYALAYAVFDAFSDLLGKPISIDRLFDTGTLLFAAATALTIGVATGIYPAVFVTRIKPVEILKGKFGNQSRGSYLKKGLITIQFVVSAVMIFGSLIILGQIKFMEEKALGFDQEQTIVLELHDQDEVRRFEAMKSEMRSVPGVVDVAGISNLPGGQFNQNAIYLQEQPTESVDCAELRVDFDVLPLMDSSWLTDVGLTSR